MVEHCYFLTWAEIKSLILVWITKWSGLSVISGISFTEKKHYIFPCTTTKTPTGIWSGLQTLCKQGVRRQSHFLMHTYCFMHSKLLDVNKKETYWIHIAVHIVVILRGRVCKLCESVPRGTAQEGGPLPSAYAGGKGHGLGLKSL